MNQVTPAKDPQIIFGLIDVWQATGNVQYLELAKQVADNLIKTEYRLDICSSRDKILLILII